jgi:hypothetical protein
MRRRRARTGAARVAIFVAYCALTNGAVLAWAQTGGGAPWPALAVVVVASLALGRLLPGWGFAAPLVGAAIWLAVIADDPDPAGRGLDVLVLVAGVLAAEAAVLAGALSAAWAWARRAD